MQRLYSIFPNSWPGSGLLLLRFGAAIPLVVEAVVAMNANPAKLSYAVEIVSIALATLLIIGLLTPITAIFQVILEARMLLTPLGFSPVAAMAAVMGISLIMLGPGAWSLDSHLFGRKRINLPNDVSKDQLPP